MGMGGETIPPPQKNTQIFRTKIVHTFRPFSKKEENNYMFIYTENDTESDKRIENDNL